MLFQFLLFFSIINPALISSSFNSFSLWSHNNRLIFFLLYYIIYLTIILSCINKIYTTIYHLLVLDKTKTSFVAFMLNSCIFLSFIFNIYLFNINSPQKPIFLEDIPLFSKYRYIILSIFCLLFIVIFFISFFNRKIYDIITTLKMPFLKENMRIIIFASPLDKALGNFCITILNKIYAYNYFKYLYFSCHFFIFYILRFIILYYFTLFCLFHGDLRNILYLIPLSFTIWLLSFFDYYFYYILIGNTNVINELLKIQNVISHKDIDYKNFKELNLITLTPSALEKGYTICDLEALITTWLKFASLNVVFEWYKKFTIIPTFIFIISYISLYFYISYLFFSENFLNKEIVILISPFFNFCNTKLLGNPMHLKPLNRPFHSTNPLYSPRDARGIPEPFMNTLKVLTSNAYNPGHLIIGELMPDGLTYRIDGTLTKGNNSSNHPLILLSPKQLIDGSYSVHGQHYIPFSTPIFVPATLLNKTLQGSTTFLETPNIKTLIENIHTVMGRP